MVYLYLKSTDDFKSIEYPLFIIERKDEQNSLRLFC